MFEGAKAFNEGVLQGNAIRARREAEQSRSQSARIGDAIGAALARKAADADNLAVEVDRLQTLVMDLTKDLIIARAEATGRIAQFEAFEAQYPDSNLLAESGQKFMNGKSKTRVRLVYEAVFDAFAKRNGIVSPADHRSN